MVYHDMPLPGRRPPRPASGAPSGFRARLELSPDAGALLFSARMNDTPVYYRGRGYCTEGPDDPPGTGLRVPSLSLLDPFLVRYRRVPSKFYKILLRAILPKLRRDGVPLECALTLSDAVPVQISISRSDSTTLLSIFSCVLRESLREVPGLPGYMLSGTALYRITPAHLHALAEFPDGDTPLSPPELERLARLCSCAEYLFFAPAVSLLRGYLQGQTAPQSSDRPGGVPRPRPDYAASPSAPSFPVPPIPSAPSFPIPRPAESARREIELPGAAARRAVILPSPLPGSVRTAVFLNDARRLKSFTVTRASFTGFRAGRPTYADMNSAQRSWYFYWRAEFYRGNLLPTDISYIYVAAYELINSVTASGTEALEHLLRLWAGYRETFPYLDRCMPGWCADYMLLHDLGTDFDELSRRVPFSVTRTDLPPELFVSLRLSESLSLLPLSVLGELGGYDILSSRFCAEDERRRAAENAVRTALGAAEEACRKAGKPLTEYCTAPEAVLPHDSFTGAVVGRACARRIELVCRPFSRDREFCALISGILRCAENCLRRRMHFPGRLREDLPPFLAEAVRQSLEIPERGNPSAPPREKPAPIVIDLERARALEDASWENTRLLLEALGENPETPETPDLVKSGDPLNSEGDTSAGTASPLSDTAPPPEESPSPVAETPDPTSVPFAGRLSETQRGVLRALLRGSPDEAARICQAAMTFPAAVYEEINELALDALGDVLIDPASGTVYEEYANDLDL